VSEGGRARGLAGPTGLVWAVFSFSFSLNFLIPFPFLFL
jgi:VanZ family protein